MSSPKKRGRGRPSSCNANQKRHIVALVKRYGATRTRVILAAKNGTADADLRSSNLFPKPVTLSVPTLCNYARDGGVELSKGRRKAA